MKRIRKILGRLLPGTPEATPLTPLPPEILDHLASRNAPSLQNWIQRLLKTDPDAPQFRQLLAEAARLGWTARDIEKLEIFGHYYGSNIQEASRRAAKFAEGADFDADLYIIAVFSLYYLGQFESAWNLLKSVGDSEAALQNRTDYPIVAALVSQAANDMEGMKRYIDLARSVAPQDAVVALNAYAMYFELGDMEGFEKVRQEYLQGRYDIAEAAFALAVIELAQDNYPEGFGMLENRYRMAEAHRYLNRGLFELPRWNGELLTGKTLLVSAEQGLGDTIQMARYLTELSRLNGARVVVETQPETLTVLQYNFPDVEFVERKYGVAPSLKFDLWVGAMSLPHLLGSTAGNIPGRAGYLRVPPENADYWRSRVAELSGGGRPRIGLAWSGRPEHRADRRRSIPFTRMMEAIRGVEADFFALQTEVPAIHPANLVVVSEEMVTLADTAALIAEMDLVITVDTSPVHVAGAIGKATWLLLPYRYEWRWGLEGEGNHWYDSVRVLRQRKHGDWDSLLLDVFKRQLGHGV